MTETNPLAEAFGAFPDMPEVCPKCQEAGCECQPVDPVAVFDDWQAARELANLRLALRESYDVLIAAERVISRILRQSRDREFSTKRQRQLRAAKSCSTCGAEARPGKTRCTPCGQKNAALSKRRATQRQSTERSE